VVLVGSCEVGWKLSLLMNWDMNRERPRRNHSERTESPGRHCAWNASACYESDFD
jgi:hypothetical protein